MYIYGIYRRTQFYCVLLLHYRVHCFGLGSLHVFITPALIGTLRLVDLDAGPSTGCASQPFSGTSGAAGMGLGSDAAYHQIYPESPIPLIKEYSLNHNMKPYNLSHIP